MEDHNHEDHNHEEPDLEEAGSTNYSTSEPVVELEETVHIHDHSGMDGLWEVMFGFEHVVAEFFWNAVFILGTLLFTKAVALRKIHKYVDDKHGVKHKTEEY